MVGTDLPRQRPLPTLSILSGAKPLCDLALHVSTKIVSRMRRGRRRGEIYVCLSRVRFDAWRDILSRNTFQTYVSQTNIVSLNRTSCAHGRFTNSIKAKRTPLELISALNSVHSLAPLGAMKHKPHRVLDSERAVLACVNSRILACLGTATRCRLNVRALRICFADLRNKSDNSE